MSGIATATPSILSAGVFNPITQVNSIMTQHTSTVENRVSIPQQIELHNPSNLTNRAIQTSVGIADTDLAAMHDELTTRHGYTPTKALEALNTLVNINHALDEVRAGCTPPLNKDLAHNQAVLRQVATLLSESPLASDINKQITALNALLNGSPELARHILEAKPLITPPTPFDQAHARAHNDPAPVPTTSPKVMHQHISAVEMAEYKHSTEFNQTKQAERVAKQAARAVEIQTLIDQPIQTILQPHPSEDDMNLKHIAATIATTATLLGGATAIEGCPQKIARTADGKFVSVDNFRITKNPHPTKGYKIHVAIKDAPGSFEDFGGSVGFRIENVKDCGYHMGWPVDGTVLEITDAIRFPLTKISDTEYEGVFYTDWAVDGNFFWKGVCHWQWNSMGVGFSAKANQGDTRFISGFDRIEDPSDTVSMFKKLRDGVSDTRYFLKNGYPATPKLLNYKDLGIPSGSSSLPYNKPDDLFSITTTSEEIK